MCSKINGANKLTISVRGLAPAAGGTLLVTLLLLLLLVLVLLLLRRAPVLLAMVGGVLAVVGGVLALRREALLGRISLVLLLHSPSGHAAILRAAVRHSVLAALLRGVLAVVLRGASVHASHLRMVAALSTHHRTTVHATATATASTTVERQDSISGCLGSGGRSRGLLLRRCLLLRCLLLLRSPEGIATKRLLLMLQKG